MPTVENEKTEPNKKPAVFKAGESSVTAPKMPTMPVLTSGERKATRSIPALILSKTGASFSKTG